MTYKTILLDVNGSKYMQQRLNLAMDLAQHHDAHLVGAAATCLPVDFYLPGMIGESGAEQAAVFLGYLRERATLELAQFEAAVAHVGVRSFEKRLIEQEADQALSLQARYSDLVVLGQTDPDEDLPGRRPNVPEYVIMNCGRPVLMVPYAGQFTSLGQRILVAWDGSTEATRAVTGALPFLRKAATVQVVVFDNASDSGRHGAQPGADIAQYLVRHGVHVEVAPQPAVPGLDIGNALLSHASGTDADLLVMGAYGHSRLREIMLGGVTRTILRSMTIPTLLAH